MPLLVWPLLIALAACLYLRLEVVSLKNEALRDKVKAKEAIEAANHEANMSAVRYEEWKTRQRPKVVYITRKVRDALAANPVWAAASVPAGVRQSISEAAADLATAKPDGAVPAPGDARPEDERGDGPGIRPKPGFFSRLLGSPPSSSGSGEAK